jgi:phenylpropionate dioxygenase-like ring-hydroxylating dioxygenase large terminal subunit
VTSTLDRTHSSLDDLLSQLREIAATGNSELMTLPPGVYDSDEVFELEMRKIFRPGWIMVCRADQVSRPGDYLSVDVATEKLVVTRDADSVIHVLSRVCRHRWMPVCEGAGNAKTLECPYHAWKFELNGALRSAPDMRDAPSYDKASLGLFPVRFEIWQGFIFVNLSGDAEPLAPRLTAIDAAIAEFRLSEWKTVWSRDYGVVEWDWKVMQDNGDCYHHVGLHRTTLFDLWPTRLIWDEPNNGHYTLTGCGTAPDQLVLDADGNQVMPYTLTPPKELTQFQRENLFLIYIHPNYFIAPTPGETFVARVFPVAPGRVRFITDLLASPEALEDPDLERKAEEAGQFLDTINSEDFRACTSVQEALSSQWAARSPLSTKERCVGEFAAWYARQLTKE